MTAEQLELMRVAACSVLAEWAAGRAVDPHRLAWAHRTIDRIKPLGRPVGTGAPEDSAHAQLPGIEAF